MKREVRLLALVGLVGVAACSGDDGVSPGDLSDAEAQALAGVILQQAFASTAQIETTPAPAAVGPALVPVTFSRSVQTTVPCPLGGNVAVDASFDYVGDTEVEDAEIDFSITHLHDGCVVATEGGTQFTLDGNADAPLTLGITVVSDATGADWDGGITGSVHWASGDRDGTCQVGLQFGGSVTQDAASFNMSGAVCGTSVSQQLDIG